MTGPYRMLSLVEMCSAGHNEGRSDGGLGEAMQKATSWLNANPGRWFIVGEVTYVESTGGQMTVGLDARTMRRSGYEAQVINNKVYARLPHESGVPLTDFVTKTRPKGVREKLPMLATDPFGWSISEMQNALTTAREWLFPAVGHVAA